VWEGKRQELNFKSEAWDPKFEGNTKNKNQEKFKSEAISSKSEEIQR